MNRWLHTQDEGILTDSNRDAELTPCTNRPFDLALAVAVLSADRKVRAGRLEKTVLLGELALHGRVRPVWGVLPAVIAAKRDGWPTKNRRTTFLT
jgi:predicted ATPase with chaperone activity